jgi:hypothetical protein
MERTTRTGTIQFIEVGLPTDVRTKLKASGSVRIRGYRARDLTVLTSVDDGLWHLSISAPDRYPAWDEIAEARYQLCPDNITMAMLLPPSDEYVNVHQNTFHLHEIRR